MKSLHIRDVDPATLASLKRLASAHHRSLQGEVRAILDHAARMAPPAQEPEIRLVTASSTGATSWNREEIYGDRGR